MTEAYQNIPSLLHDAEFMRLDWEPDLLSLRLYFTCLMRNVDGSEISDPVVELRLSGVELIAAYHAPTSIEVRPSEFRNDSPLTAADLTDWKQEPCEAYLTINSATADFKMATSCEIDWLFGEPVKNSTGPATRLGIHLTFGGSQYAKHGVSTGLYFECGVIEPMRSGVPLPIEDWAHQFEAWWKEWQDHWDQEDSERADDDQEAVLEDRFIPAGTDASPDLAYRPPSKPAFQVESTDAPGELLLPIKDFHSGLQEHDWQRMASVYPNFDMNKSDRAEELSDLYLTHEFGRWVYVRQIDSWWAEDVRACVVVRGIEHVMPDDEDPAMNRETVITYGLLKSGDRWIISTWTQGWPQYGSAPKIEGRQSWRDDWHFE